MLRKHNTNMATLLRWWELPTECNETIGQRHVKIKGRVKPDSFGVWNEVTKDWIRDDKGQPIYGTAQFCRARMTLLKTSCHTLRGETHSVDTSNTCLRRIRL